MSTPGQTIGPFFGYSLPFPGDSELVDRAHPDAIRLHGTVLDGSGAPVPDALIELWQSDRSGSVAREPGSLHRDSWTFTGWGRASTDGAGHYTFTTIEPGRTDPDRPAFLAVAVFARGLLDRLFTRIYLPDDEGALACDPLLARLPAERRATLLAQREPSGLRFDIVLSGDHETVFLAHS